MKKRIFIVDDNMMMREFLKSYFSKEYDVTSFASAEAALYAIHPTNQPDVLLLDYEMEGLSGFELLKNLKTSGFYKDIPVLFLSGKQKSEIRIECLKEGASDFICKPFNPTELGLKVKLHLNQN